MFHLKLGILFALAAFFFVYIHSEGIGSSCFYSEDCGNKYFECTNGICSCDEDHIPDRKNKWCTVDIFKPCKDQETCYDPNATCTDATVSTCGTCQCKKGFTFNKQKMACAVVIGNNCTKSAECIEGTCKTAIPCQNGSCNYTSCFCNEPLQSDKNGTKCRPAVHDDCSAFNECAKENAICNKAKKCVCAETFKPAERNNETYCLAMLDYSCQNATDCADIGADCIVLNKTETPSKIVTVSTIVAPLKTRHCRNYRRIDFHSRWHSKEPPKKYCVCGTGFVRHPNATECLKVATHFNDSCVHDIQCSTYSGFGSQCTNNYCECKKEFYFDVDFNRCVRSCLCNDQHELKTIIQDLAPVLKKLAENNNIEISEVLRKINKLSKIE